MHSFEADVVFGKKETNIGDIYILDFYKYILQSLLITTFHNLLFIIQGKYACIGTYFNVLFWFKSI